VKTTGEGAVDLAEQWASENGYEAPYVVFNCDHNSAGLGIVDKFTWVSATVYEG
jgi:hypothetical protein